MSWSWAEFIVGLATGFVVTVVLLALAEGYESTRFNQVDRLPSACLPGQTAVLTSVTPAQYYVCAAGWKLR